MLGINLGFILLSIITLLFLNFPIITWKWGKVILHSSLTFLLVSSLIVTLSSISSSLMTLLSSYLCFTRLVITSISLSVSLWKGCKNSNQYLKNLLFNEVGILMTLFISLFITIGYIKTCGLFFLSTRILFWKFH